MGLIVQVGEVSEMKSKPKNFPTCGNWEFEVSVLEDIFQPSNVEPNNNTFWSRVLQKYTVI